MISNVAPFSILYSVLFSDNFLNTFPFFWHCTECSLLNLCASSPSVSEGQTEKWSQERLLKHISDILERRVRILYKRF